ncbi:hypothetical protein RF55_4907 [Lasius niger]|uniref:Uncharacterized protein n=1 Tax=Lasius niger TaxID=67767 RepID=A0A0J7NR21_LASNI|nr:hypothetical protein RF55_4907 [Lasius niger]
MKGKSHHDHTVPFPADLYRHRGPDDELWTFKKSLEKLLTLDFQESHHSSLKKKKKKKKQKMKKKKKKSRTLRAHDNGREQKRDADDDELRADRRPG